MLVVERHRSFKVFITRFSAPSQAPPQPVAGRMWPTGRMLYNIDAARAQKLTIASSHVHGSNWRLTKRTLKTDKLTVVKTIGKLYCSSMNDLKLKQSKWSIDCDFRNRFVNNEWEPTTLSKFSNKIVFVIATIDNETMLCVGGWYKVRTDWYSNCIRTHIRIFNA